MKVSELKQLIKQSVNERVVELKEQFEHIETKGSLNKANPTTPDGVDSGDKKMETGRNPAPASNIVNDVNKVKDQKGAMNEMVQHEEGQPLQHSVDNSVCKVCNQKLSGRMNEAIVDPAAARVAPAATRAPAPAVAKSNQPCPTCGGMKEDVEIEIPMPRGSEGAEVSAEVVPGEEGEGSVAELIIVDDEVTPQTIDNDMIEIEIPDSRAEGLEGEGSELDGEPESGMPQGEGFPGIEPEADRPETDDEFDRMADLAGVEDEQEKPAFPPKK